LEDNYPTNNAIQKMGGKIYKKYRNILCPESLIFKNNFTLHNLISYLGCDLLADELLSEISRRAKLNHEATAQHLDFLKTLGLIQEKRFGRIKIYRFKIENMSAKILRNLFRSWDGN
ncbi:MAG: hypothetical protein ACFFBS_06360, partial [Promethearchaeota archaeon]